MSMHPHINECPKSSHNRKLKSIIPVILLINIVVIFAECASVSHHFRVYFHLNSIDSIRMRRRKEWKKNEKLEHKFKPIKWNWTLHFYWTIDECKPLHCNDLSNAFEISWLISGIIWWLCLTSYLHNKRKRNCFESSDRMRKRDVHLTYLSGIVIALNKIRRRIRNETSFLFSKFKNKLAFACFIFRLFCFHRNRFITNQSRMQNVKKAERLISRSHLHFALCRLILMFCFPLCSDERIE